MRKNAPRRRPARPCSGRLDDDLAVARLAAELDRAEGEGMRRLSFPAGTKTPFWPSISTTARGGDGQDLLAGRAVEDDPHEHPELEQVVGVLGLGQDGTVRVWGSTIAPTESSLASNSRSG